MKTILKKSIGIIAGLFTLFVQAEAQTGNAIALETCYTKARENYPLIRQMDLIEQSNDYTLSNLSKGYMPQFGIYGQATYQSAVTAVPARIEGFGIPPIDKDQYKIYGELNQVIFDGGIIRQQKAIQESNNLVEAQKLEVELYKLKERVNQLFFGILMLDRQLEQVAILKKDITAGIDKADAAFKNGIALKSSLEVLQVELLKANQRETELKSAKISYLNMLSQFINQPLNEQTVIEKPANLLVPTEIRRPELSLFEAQDKSLSVQTSLLNARNLPRLNFFVQGGYGRPALDMLSNEFDLYYLGGLRLQWNISGFYTLKNDKHQVDLNRSNTTLQKETFLFNTRLSVIQQTEEISKLQQLLSGDDEIIRLRKRIQNASASQLENGVVTSSDYLREVNAHDLAQQNKILHEVQLLMAQYNQKTITGN